MARVFNCPDCPGTLTLRTDSAGRLAYLCTRKGCRGRLGAHQESGEPLGTPADARTRGLRKDAHEVFDRIWKTGKMKRKEAYAWLRKKLELDPDKGHISMFNAEQCKHLERAVREDFPDLFLELD